MDKKELLEEIARSLETRLAELRKSVRTSQEMTRDAPGRIESRYDTSREEMGWLATGQAALLAEWEGNYRIFKGIAPEPKQTVQIGAFFRADSTSGDISLRCLVCEGGSGFECKTSFGTITLVSPSSPLAKAAMGRSQNDTFVVNGRVNYILKEVA